MRRGRHFTITLSSTAARTFTTRWYASCTNAVVCRVAAPFLPHVTMCQPAQFPISLMRRKDLGDGSTQQKASSGRLFTPPGGCSPRCAGVLRSPRKRQPLQRQLTPIASTREVAFSSVAKRRQKATKGNRYFTSEKTQESSTRSNRSSTN